MTALACKKKEDTEIRCTSEKKKTSSVAKTVAVKSLAATPDRIACRRGAGTLSPLVFKDKQEERRVFSTSKPTPLACALQAQWTLLQQNIQLRAIPPTAEQDLLRVLESLPEHKNAILSDVEGVLPYLLAFAVAPIPSERTQAIALGAMQATVGSLVAVWGKKAAAVLVHDFLTIEHNALHALEVTLSVALGDDADNKDGKSVDKMKTGRHKDKKGHGLRCVNTFTETRRAIISGALELILIMVTISESTAAAVLTHPKLIQSIVLCLPNSTPTQACDVANILHTLGAIDGAAEILIAYKAYHSALWFVRSSVCVNTGEVPSLNVTVTAVCYFLRLAVRLAGSPAAFEVLQNDTTIFCVIGELLRSQWGELVDIACLWLTTTVEKHTTQCAGLIFDIFSKSRVGEQLADMLLWPPNMAKYAAAAALCWRWLALANPTAVGSFLVSNSTALFAFLQVAVTQHASTRPLNDAASAAPDLHDGGCCENSVMACQLLTDVICTLGICYGLASRETRGAMRRVILSSLSPVTQAEMQRCVNSVFAGLQKFWFDIYPVATVQSRRFHHISDVSISKESFAGSASETDVDIDDGIPTRRPTEDRNPRRSLSSGDQWHEFLFYSLTRLFRGNAHGTLFVAPTQRGQKRSLTACSVGSNLLGAGNKHNKQLGHISFADTTAAAGAVAATSNSANCTSFAPYSCSPPLSKQNVVINMQARQMGHPFYLDSIRVILQLAHYYKHNTRRETVCGAATTRVVPTSSLSSCQKKDPNPWALPEKVESSRRWNVADLQRSDALLFYVSYDNIVAELTEALGEVEKHTRELNRRLQVCPTRAARRRCVLNDLYMHVYPKIHMFLLFIQHHMARSRPVLQVIAENERAIHSGNILDIYQAVWHCVGGGTHLSGGISIQSQ